jgi:endonuclease/exonuclease/phosphatase (EEP) superfamily protein YafD
MQRNDDVLIATGRHLTAGVRYGAESFNRVLFGAALAAFLVTAASFIGRASWVLELLTHFRFQVAAGSLVILLCALLRRRLVVAAMAAIAAAANASPLIPYIMPGPLQAEASTARIRLMAANVSFRNSDYAALVAEIRQQDPDVVGLLEVDQTWVDELSALNADYAWSILRPEEGAYGLALYSHLPLRELPGSPYIEGGLQTAITVELELERAPATLILAHVRAPTSPGKARVRNVQLGRIGELLVADANDARILLGDLNATPWSPYYRQLVSTAGLRNAALGRGYQATWPSGFGMLGIPIDHCLVSDGLQVRMFDTGSDIGSDHLPIIIDLAAGDSEE